MVACKICSVDGGASDLDKLVRGGEAAHAEGHEDPAAGVAALGRVLGQLLADLTVDLISVKAKGHRSVGPIAAVSTIAQRPHGIHIK